MTSPSGAALRRICFLYQPRNFEPFHLLLPSNNPGPVRARDWRPEGNDRARQRRQRLPPGDHPEVDSRRPSIPYFCSFSINLCLFLIMKLTSQRGRNTPPTGHQQRARTPPATQRGNLRSPTNVMWMVLECGGEAEHLENTHTVPGRRWNLLESSAQWLSVSSLCSCASFLAHTGSAVTSFPDLRDSFVARNPPTRLVTKITAAARPVTSARLNWRIGALSAVD